MKPVISLLAVPTALAAIVLSVADRVDGAAKGVSKSGVSKSGVAAKIEYCKDCHGLSGQGYHGYLVMPRLAGQNPEYIENQLRAFVSRTREKELFVNMAGVHGTSPEIQAALAAHFRDLNPPPFGGGPRHLTGTGRQIYEDGIPQANVPACTACHGPEARGQGLIPRLAGQLYPYILKELTRWDKDRAQSSTADQTTAVMLPIAHNLNKSQIEALAAYLSYLK
jgi:cytochrome c553